MILVYLLVRVSKRHDMVPSIQSYWLTDSICSVIEFSTLSRKPNRRQQIEAAEPIVPDVCPVGFHLTTNSQ